MANQEKFRAGFKSEASVLTRSLTNHLLQLEVDPQNEGDLAAIFRIVHTLKSSAAMFGYQEISHFAQELENLVDRTRSRRLPVDASFVELGIEARDHILALLESPLADGAQTRSSDLIETARALSQEPEPALVNAATTTDPVEPRSSITPVGDETTYRIRFSPDPRPMGEGNQALNTLRRIGQLGECTLIPLWDSLPSLDRLNPNLIYAAWDVLVTTRVSADLINNVFEEWRDQALVEIVKVENPGRFGNDQPKLGEILAQRGAIRPETIESIAQKQLKIGGLLAQAGVAPQEIRSALEEQRYLRQRSQKNRGVIQIQKQNRQKLEIFTELTARLNRLQAQLALASQRWSDPDHRLMAQNLVSLSAELDQAAASLRKIALTAIVPSLQRLTSELALELGRPAEFVVSGEVGEIDEALGERLGDLLSQLVKAMLRYSIEPSAMRLARGKPPVSTIVLTIEEANHRMSLRLQDDGAGLDEIQVWRQAVDRGLLSTTPASSDEIWQAFLQPGFAVGQSTDSLSELALSLGLVARGLATLDGSLTLSSQFGHGTTLNLSLPTDQMSLTGLIVNVDSEVFFLPLAFIEEVTAKELPTPIPESGRKPRQALLDLRKVIGLPSVPRQSSPMVICSRLGQRIGLVVDRVIGEERVLIKNWNLASYRGLNVIGTGLREEGGSVLILDLATLIAEVELGSSSLRQAVSR